MSQAARILVVDDNPEMVGVIERALSREGHCVVGRSDPREAIDAFHRLQPDVCVLDFAMPHVSGSELLDAIKAIDPAVEVVFLTAEDETALAVDLMKRGAIDFLLKPIDLGAVARAVSRALEHRRLLMENTAYRARLETLVAEQTQALNEALRDLTTVHTATLDSLAMALDLRDQGTGGHSRRVSAQTTGIARTLGIAGSDLIQIEHGALLHDIGKLKIPDRILCKPAKLTDEEWRVMVRHAEYGFEFLSGIEFLKGAAEMVYSHHEKFDGRGYPRGLTGDAIPFGARVFAIVDAVDAMTNSRPYHAAVSFAAAAAEVRRCAGHHFDPDLVEPALTCLAGYFPRQVDPLVTVGASME
ncbi:MAG: HD domain-containing phosphohydrolase [Vicinamibacterales bacterium]